MSVQLNSMTVGFPVGRVWAEPVGAWVFTVRRRKEMNLSSCVADSVVLSFDSDGQALGSGTSLSPLSSFQHPTLATFEWSLIRWG